MPYTQTAHLIHFHGWCVAEESTQSMLTDSTQAGEEIHSLVFGLTKGITMPIFEQWIWIMIKKQVLEQRPPGWKGL